MGPACNKDGTGFMKIQLSDHFTTGRLLRYALPSVLMMIFTSVYGVVDGFFVSNFTGKTSFAAVNFIMPFLIVLGAMGFMIGTGGSALVGKLLGEEKKERANSVFSMLIYVSVVCGIVIAIVGMITLRPVAVLLGADETMVPDCVLYGRLVLIGLPALMLQYEFHSFFVTAERPQLGLYVTLIAGVMNMILDAVLVGLLSLGIPGAAVATVISQMFGGFLPLAYFARKNTSLLKLGKPVWDGSALLKALGNGSSEFVSCVSMSVVSMLYNAQLMKYAGEDGVAAYGVLMYVSMIFMAVFIGYGVGTAPIFSFHFGAQHPDELRSVLRKSLGIIAVCSAGMIVGGELLARPLSLMYVGYDEGLMQMTLHAFRIFSFCFIFCGIPIFGSSYFTALNDGATSAAISFLRTVVFQAAAVLLLPLVFGLDGIWYSLIVAELAAGLITVFFWIKKRI